MPLIMTSFSLPPLLYEYDALEPNFDQATMKIHHSKHHPAYIKTLNEEITTKNLYQDKSLIDICRNVYKDNKNPNLKGKLAKIRNNAGGHYNHSFFWYCLGPNSSENDISEKLLNDINESFGGLDKMKSEFNAAALLVFGSGWSWLCYDTKNKKLVVMKTPNQNNPLMRSTNLIPILTLDVWEHAYYLKYQNLRKDYITSFWNVINWKNVSIFYEKYALQNKIVEVNMDGTINTTYENEQEQKQEKGEGYEEGQQEGNNQENIQNGNGSQGSNGGQ